MRRHVMRRGPRAAGSALGYDPAPPRESESSKLARLTREIAEETGGSCALLLGLIERRAPSIPPSEAAAYILSEWRKDGPARERLLAHAAKSPEVLAAERALALEVKRLLQRFAGKPFDTRRVKEIRGVLFKFVRARIPKTPARQLAQALRDAVDFREDRFVVRLEGIAHLLASAPLAS